MRYTKRKNKQRPTQKFTIRRGVSQPRQPPTNNTPGFYKYRKHGATRKTIIAAAYPSLNIPHSHSHSKGRHVQVVVLEARIERPQQHVSVLVYIVCHKKAREAATNKSVRKNGKYMGTRNQTMRNEFCHEKGLNGGRRQPHRKDRTIETTTVPTDCSHTTTKHTRKTTDQ